MKALIRDARLEDLPRIVGIYNAAIPGRRATADTEPITVESRMDWFYAHNAGDRPLWVYVTQNEGDRMGTILGWISLNSFYGRPAYQATTEVSIYVAPEAQGQGIGSCLLQKIIAHCQTSEIKTVMGFVFAHNDPSLNLLQKFGFEQWGYCPRIALLDGEEKDLVILGKRIRI